MHIALLLQNRCVEPFSTTEDGRHFPNCSSQFVAGCLVIIIAWYVVDAYHKWTLESHFPNRKNPKQFDIPILPPAKDSVLANHRL